MLLLTRDLVSIELMRRGADGATTEELIEATKRHRESVKVALRGMRAAGEVVSQRTGRAGRTTELRYFRVQAHDTEEDTVPDFRIPEFT